MRRLPILPTLIVLAAVATMIGLGIWQIQRAAWKEALLARYEAAEHQPPLLGLPGDAARNPEKAAFRIARIACDLAGPAIQIGGRDRSGAIGYRNIKRCDLRDGRAIMVDIGWSAPGRAAQPLSLARQGRTGYLPVFVFTGRLIPDPQLAGRVGGGVLPILLVSDVPEPDLKPSVPPSIADIPNNHRAYAVQWFLFAAVALIVYVLALRRRAR